MRNCHTIFWYRYGSEFSRKFNQTVAPFEKIEAPFRKIAAPFENLNFNLFCNDNVCFRIFAWSATLSTSLS